MFVVKSFFCLTTELLRILMQSIHLFLHQLKLHKIEIVDFER